MQEAREDSYAIYWKGWREQFQYPWCFPVKSWWGPVEKKQQKSGSINMHLMFGITKIQGHVQSLNLQISFVVQSSAIFFGGCSMLTHLYQTNIEKWCSCMQYWALSHVPFILRLFNDMGCGRVGLWWVLISLISAGPNGSKRLQATRRSFFGRKTLKISTIKRWLNISQKAIGQSGMV
jgi:hypothetical protein